MAGDLFVVIAKVTRSPGAAGAIAGFLLFAFYGLWFGVSALAKKVTPCHLAASASNPGSEFLRNIGQEPPAMNLHLQGPCRWTRV